MATQIAEFIGADITELVGDVNNFSAMYGDQIISVSDITYLDDGTYMMTITYDDGTEALGESLSSGTTGDETTDTSTGTEYTQLEYILTEENPEGYMALRDWYYYYIEDDTIYGTIVDDHGIIDGAIVLSTANYLSEWADGTDAWSYSEETGYMAEDPTTLWEYNNYQYDPSEAHIWGSTTAEQRSADSDSGGPMRPAVIVPGYIVEKIYSAQQVPPGNPYNVDPEFLVSIGPGTPLLATSQMTILTSPNVYQGGDLGIVAYLFGGPSGRDMNDIQYTEDEIDAIKEKFVLESDVIAHVAELSSEDTLDASAFTLAFQAYIDSGLETLKSLTVSKMGNLAKPVFNFQKSKTKPLKVSQLSLLAAEDVTETSVSVATGLVTTTETTSY